MYIDKCIICNCNITEVLNLGSQPLANNYLQLNEECEKYPLSLYRCKYCFHLQLNYVVEPEILFKNYVYVSGTSNTNRQYFYEFAKNILINQNKKKIKILDIACNDGSQLIAFEKVIKDMELDIELIKVGVDPAENIYNKYYEINKRYNNTIYCGFIDDVIQLLEEKYKTFDVIIAQNVFAHVDNPNNFLKNCYKLCNDESTIYIQTSQANMIIKNEFDTVYHEHISFFNTNSMNILCSNNKLFLNNVKIMPVHGSSYLFEINKYKNHESNVVEYLYKEITDDIYTESLYEKYMIKCLIYKNWFHNYLLCYKLDGYNIIGFGSTAKSNTLMNFTGINNKIVDYIIDENELKQNLYTPGSNIIIKRFEDICIETKTLIVVFAWNYFDEVYKKLYDKLHENNNTIIIMNINPISFLYIDSSKNVQRTNLIDT